MSRTARLYVIASSALRWVYEVTSDYIILPRGALCGVLYLYLYLYLSLSVVSSLEASSPTLIERDTCHVTQDVATNFTSVWRHIWRSFFGRYNFTLGFSWFMAETGLEPTTFWLPRSWVRCSSHCATRILGILTLTSSPHPSCFGYITTLRNWQKEIVGMKIICQKDENRIYLWTASQEVPDDKFIHLALITIQIIAVLSGMNRGMGMISLLADTRGGSLLQDSRCKSYRFKKGSKGCYDNTVFYSGNILYMCMSVVENSKSWVKSKWIDIMVTSKLSVGKNKHFYSTYTLFISLCAVTSARNAVETVIYRMHGAFALVC